MVAPPGTAGVPPASSLFLWNNTRLQDRTTAMMPTEHQRESPPPSRPWALWILLLLLAIWGGWFIYRTSFVIDGRRFFCLFDDAVISMTYARHLVAGHGLS